MFQLLSEYYPLLLTIISCSIIGTVAGILGVFVLLKKQTLLGDTISHASLPGIVMALLISQQKDPAILMLGGTISGIIGTLLTIFIAKNTTLHKDTILGIILSVFFGFGLLLMSQLQKYLYADQAIVNKFLFGNASIVLLSDLKIIIVLGLIIIVALYACFKEFILETFDPAFAQSIGYSVQSINIIITFLLIMAIVIGLQTVGVILMSSLLIAPAAASRQWTNKIVTMITISACIGTSTSIIGTLVSIHQQMPTGPVIVVILSLIVFISLLCAPERGMIWPLIKKVKS